MCHILLCILIYYFYCFGEHLLKLVFSFLVSVSVTSKYPHKSCFTIFQCFFTDLFTFRFVSCSYVWRRLANIRATVALVLMEESARASASISPELCAVLDA